MVNNNFEPRVVVRYFVRLKKRATYSPKIRYVKDFEWFLQTRQTIGGQTEIQHAAEL